MIVFGVLKLVHRYHNFLKCDMDAQDTSDLLKLIKYICYKFQGLKYAPSEIYSDMDKLINFKQLYNMSGHIYLDKFNDVVRAFKHSAIFIIVS